MVWVATHLPKKEGYGRIIRTALYCVIQFILHTLFYIRHKPHFSTERGKESAVSKLFFFSRSGVKVQVYYYHGVTRLVLPSPFRLPRSSMEAK